MKKPNWLLGIALAFGMAAAPGMAQAQQDDDAPQQADQTADQSNDAYETEDVITVYSRGRVDRGMKSFMDGDFAQAEIEFELNLKCAERTRMLEEMAIEQSVSDAIGVESGGASRTGGWGDDGGVRVFDVPQNTYRAPTDPSEIPERTCGNSDWQLYMIAMSQLQQGKLEEAKRNFYKVIRTSREPYLFDAHYRLALLEILDGNFDKAEARVKTLKVLQARCVRQGERCEFREEIDEIVAYIEPALEQARLQGVAG